MKIISNFLPLASFSIYLQPIIFYLPFLRPQFTIIINFEFLETLKKPKDIFLL